MTANYRLTSVAALLMGCGGVTSPDATQQTEQLGVETQADTQACVEGTATSGWSTGSFARHSGMFSVELDATPGTTDEDALVGLASAAPGNYADLAAIVRFNADGKLDARDGDTYRADTDIRYQAGRRHHLLFDIDMDHHKYTARAVIDGSSYDIARDFSFRTGQTSTTDLGAYGVKVDAGGPLEVCNVVAHAAGCTSADSGQGFINQAIPAQDKFVTVTFDATPSIANMDAVMGVSPAPVRSFNDIAAAVRFNPDGKIDARDGDVYREIPFRDPYVAGTTYHFALLVDVLTHTYSVALNGTLALQNLAFRAQQAHATSLTNLVIESDAAEGSVVQCGLSVKPPPGAAYVHDVGLVAPVSVALPDGRYLNVQSSQTLLFDAQGLAAGTAPISGPLAVDAAGNLYRTGTFWGTYDTGAGTLTSAGGNDAFLVKYDAGFNPVWSARYGGTGNDTVSGPIVNASGDVIFVLNDKLAHVDPRGNLVYGNQSFSTGAKFALAPDGSVFSTDPPPSSTQLSITKYEPDGSWAWTHSMPITEGGVNLMALAADASGGVVFAGEIDGQLDLGQRHRGRHRSQGQAAHSSLGQAHGPGDRNRVAPRRGSHQQPLPRFGSRAQGGVRGPALHLGLPGHSGHRQHDRPLGRALDQHLKAGHRLGHVRRAQGDVDLLGHHRGHGRLPRSLQPLPFLLRGLPLLDQGEIVLERQGDLGARRLGGTAAHRDQRQ